MGQLTKKELLRVYERRGPYVFCECDICQEVFSLVDIQENSLIIDSICPKCKNKVKYYTLERYIHKILKYVKHFKKGREIIGTSTIGYYNKLLVGVKGIIVNYLNDLSYPFQVEWEGNIYPRTSCSIYEIKLLDPDEKWSQIIYE